MHRLISTLTKQFWGWTLLALVLMPGDIKAQSLALPELTFLPIAGEKTADQSCNTATVDGSQDQSPVIPDTRRLTAYCVAQVFPVHGRWTALDNVANFDLKVLNPGPDYYHNRVNGRAVSTKCANGEGSVVVDFSSGGHDSCVRPVSCEAGYQLVIR